MTYWDKLIITLREIMENNPDEMISIYNQYANKIVRAYDWHIYYMSEFNQLFGKMSPLEIASLTESSSGFTICDSYFNTDENGELFSFDWLGSKHCNIDINDVAAYMFDNDDSLGCDKVEYIIQRYSNIKGRVEMV